MATEKINVKGDNMSRENINNSNEGVSQICKMAIDTVTHKKLVLDTCLLMTKHFMEEGKIQLGIQLMQRACTHDNSKFDTEEFKSLASILKSKKCFTDAKSKLSKGEKEAIQYHWSHNRHHPEYYNDPSEMEEIDMIEMVCDWFARSLQYETNFLEFVVERQENRFKFKQEQFNIIYSYCELIQNLYSKEIGQ